MILEKSKRILYGLIPYAYIKTFYSHSLKLPYLRIPDDTDPCYRIMLTPFLILTTA